MQTLKKQIEAFADNSVELLAWAKKEKKRNPEAPEIAESIILSAYDKLIDAGADALLLESGFEQVLKRK